jgi:hypothetical protein
VAAKPQKVFTRTAFAPPAPHKSTRSRKHMPWRAPSSRSRTLVPPSRLPPPPCPPPAGRCPPAQGRRHPPPPPPGPSRHDGRARPLQDVVRVNRGARGGLCVRDTPAARARAGPHARAQTGGVAIRPQRAQCQNSQCTPPKTTAKPAPHPPSRRLLCGGVKPCAAVPHTRGPAAFRWRRPVGGGGAHPGVPPPMQARRPKTQLFSDCASYRR